MRQSSLLGDKDVTFHQVLLNTGVLLLPESNNLTKENKKWARGQALGSTRVSFLILPQDVARLRNI